MKNANQRDVRFSVIGQGQTRANAADDLAPDEELSDAELIAVAGGGGFNPPPPSRPYVPKTPNPM
jgi:hypothetical protein